MWRPSKLLRASLSGSSHRITISRHPPRRLSCPQPSIRRQSSNLPLDSTPRSNAAAFRDLPSFRPPPIHQRLRPLIPFFIVWSIITSLAVHLLRQRIRAQEDLDRSSAQISVLESLVTRLKSGERLSADEMRRELEMVGLRERSGLKKMKDEGDLIMENMEEDLREMRNISWSEVILGRRKQFSKEQTEEEAVREWTQVVNEATKTEEPPVRQSATTPTSERAGIARRASSSTVYL